MVSRSKGLTIAVGLGILLNPLNSSMIAVALVRLQDVFRVDFTQVSWAIFVFYITSAVAQPVMGRVSDLFGQKKVFLAGVTTAFVASALAPLASSFAVLLVFRVAQAVGTSMVGSVGLALVRRHIHANQAGALALVSVFVSGAAALGPAIGGLVLPVWDWRGIFWVNLPFAVASALLAWRVIPSDPPPTLRAPDGDRRGRLDLVGVLLFLAGTTALLWGVLSARQQPPVVWGGTAAAGMVLLVAFIRREWTHFSPIIPLRALAREPRLAQTNLAFLTVNVAYYAAFFSLPSYLQQVLGQKPGAVGLLMLVLGLVSLAASPLAGRWIDKRGLLPSLVTAGVCLVTASAGVAALGLGAGSWILVPILALYGAAAGLSNVGLQVAMIRSTPQELSGVSSGLFLTSRYGGTIVASVVMVLIFPVRVNGPGMAVLGLVLTALAGVFLLIARRLTPPPEKVA